MMACEQKTVKIKVNVRFKVKMGYFQYSSRSCMKAKLFQDQAKKGQDCQWQGEGLEEGQDQVQNESGTKL